MSAYLEPDNIPIEIFKEMSIDKINSVIRELKEHSLIVLIINGDSFKIHRLLQEVIRLSNEDIFLFLGRAVDQALTASKKFVDTNQETWPQERIWLSHIKALSNHMPKNEKKAQLQFNYAKIARHFGLYKLAHNLLTESLFIKEVLHSNNHLNLIDNLNELAKISMELGFNRQAQEIYTRVLAIKKTEL